MAGKKDTSQGRKQPQKSIWDKPKIKKLAAQPVGDPIDLTDAEARAIVESVQKDAVPWPPRLEDSSHLAQKARRQMSRDLSRRAERLSHE
jgi:hypothetical protein